MQEGSLRTGRLRTLAGAAVVALVGLVLTTGPAKSAPLSLQLTPETVTASAGSGVLFTATIDEIRAVATVIDFENTGDGSDSPTTVDATCTIAAGSQSCSATVFAGGAGAQSVYAWIDSDASDATCEADRTQCTGFAAQEEQDEAAFPGAIPELDQTDVSTLNAQTTSAARLDCSPEDVPTNVGSTVSITCTGTASDGSAAALLVDLERLSGPNDPDGGALDPVDVDAVGTTPFTFTTTSAVAGTDVMCFFVDSDADTQFNSSSAADGSDCASEAGGTPDDSDFTDVVRVFFGTTPSPSVPPTTSPTVTPTPANGTDTQTITFLRRNGRAERRIKTDVTVTIGGQTQVLPRRSINPGTVTFTLPAGTYAVTVTTASTRYACTVTPTQVTIPAGGTVTSAITCQRVRR